jgi:hypothetical protein
VAWAEKTLVVIKAMKTKSLTERQLEDNSDEADWEQKGSKARELTDPNRSHQVIEFPIAEALNLGNGTLHRSRKRPDIALPHLLDEL